MGFLLFPASFPRLRRKLQQDFDFRLERMLQCTESALPKRFFPEMASGGVLFGWKHVRSTCGRPSLIPPSVDLALKTPLNPVRSLFSVSVCILPNEFASITTRLLVQR